jgi:hypothetical protein
MRHVNPLGIYAQDLIRLSSKFISACRVRWSYVQTIGIDSTNLLTGAKTTGRTRNEPMRSLPVRVSFLNPLNQRPYFLPAMPIHLHRITRDGYILAAHCPLLFIGPVMKAGTNMISSMACLLPLILTRLSYRNH